MLEVLFSRFWRISRLVRENWYSRSIKLQIGSSAVRAEAELAITRQHAQLASSV